jgi:hypothetical protein
MVQSDFVGIFGSAVGFRGEKAGSCLWEVVFHEKSAPVCAIYMNFAILPVDTTFGNPLSFAATAMIFPFFFPFCYDELYLTGFLLLGNFVIRQPPVGFPKISPSGDPKPGSGQIIAALGISTPIIFNNKI